MNNYRIKNILTMALAAVLVSSWILPAANVSAEEPASAVIEAGVDVVDDSVASPYPEELDDQVGDSADGAEGGNAVVSTAETEYDTAKGSTVEISDGSAGNNSYGTTEGTVENNTTESQTDSAESQTTMTEEPVDSDAEGQTVLDTDEDLRSTDVSSEETLESSVPESEEDAADLSLSSANEMMLMSAAPGKADYEGFEVTGVLSFYIINVDGIRINSWFNEKDKINYLFVPSGEDLSAMEVCFEGVKLDLTSNGMIDKKNFVITGAFSASGEMITLTDYDNKEYKLKVMQSDLPNVMITLNGTDLNTVDSNGKNIKYQGNSLTIISSDGTEELVQNNNVELKGRGNTTWWVAEKKPYQIKTDKKQSVLDMGKAKKWVLLANAFDDTLMRNKLMFDIAGQMDGWYVCNFEYVDVWIDGNYRGNYIIGEKCEIGSSRLDLNDENAVLMELDDYFYAEEDYYLYNENLGKHFSLSDSVSDDENVINAAMNSFNEKLNGLMNLLNYADPNTLPLDAISSFLDVEEAAKWYIINEFSENMECLATSFFWYIDGVDDVLHLGPVWDFDSALGNKDYYNPIMENIHNSVLFRSLLQCNSFREVVNSVYSNYRGLFSGASSYAQTIKETINNSAEMNYTRWDRLGKENEKSGSNPFAATYDAAVGWLSSWLDRKYASFDPCALEYYTYVRDGYIYIVYRNDSISSSTFYIWSNENGQDDMRILPASRNAAGNWIAAVPISAFNSDGTFSIHIYSGFTCQAGFEANIEMTPILEASLSGQSLEVSLRYHGANLPVSAGIWSNENGADDLTWYPMTKQLDGSYKTVVDLGTHKSTGQYNVHIYGRGVYLAGGSVVLESCAAPSVTVTASEENKSVAEICASNIYGLTNVQAAVWGNKNGQNDLKWYKLQDNGDGTFTAAVDLKTHGESGTFNFHVYGVNGGVNQFLDGKIMNVSGEDVGIPDPSVEASLNGKDLSVVLSNAGEYPAVRAAIWSENNGQDDLTWYNMAKQADGTFTLAADLTSHKSFGKFIIHMYSGSTYVAGFTVMVEPPYADVRMQGKNLEIELYNADMFSSARAAVWSEENGQDDLAWYTLTKGSDGVYKVTVNPGLHKNAGRFIIHIYSGSTFLTGCIYEVPEIAVPYLNITASSDDKNKVIVSVDNGYGLENVRTAVWGKKNGQNDMKWYKLSSAGDGVFTAEIDLSTHKETGDFYFHTYADNNGRSVFLDGGAFVLN